MLFYKDELLKIKYYKNKIASLLVNQSMFIDDMSVQKRLDSIDTKLAIFQYIETDENTEFDTALFNSYIESIYQDLKILYELAYEFTTKRFIKTKEYAETHLRELENLAKRYEFKTQFEINSTSLGNTILFQTSGFNMELKNSLAKITLGSIDVFKGSKLACIIDGENLSDDSIIFSIGNNNCSPYSYNKDFFTVPGDPEYKLYAYEPPQDITANTMCAMNIQDFVPKLTNQYLIYAGLDCVNIETDLAKEIREKEEGTPFYLDGTSGRITFYVLEGSYIAFDFNKAPLSKNFSGTKIENLQQEHKITIEYDQDFAFNFVTDGVVYARRNHGITQNDMLYYPDAIDANQFLVKEFTPINKVSYDVSVTISNVKDPVRINAIAIKELSTWSDLIL